MLTLEQIRNKILDRSEVRPWSDRMHAEGKKIVFTNGCFDLLHYGHLHYLSEAADLGDMLIVGINSQNSVSNLKGPHRPIKDEKTRVFQIASLFFVERVVVFDEDTPAELIREALPDVLVKGGDWPLHEIVGADTVMERGGEVRCLSFQDGYSTTLLEQKIKSS